MAENGEHNGLAARTYTGLGRVTSTEFVWTEDDEESLRVLKLAGAFGIIMLLAYLAYDQFVWGRNGAGTATALAHAGGDLPVLRCVVDAARSGAIGNSGSSCTTFF